MIRYLIGKGLTLFAIASIAAAVLMTVIRLLLPYIDLYQQDIERWLSDALGQPLHIKSVEAEWHGLGPLLHLHDIAFLDRHGGGVRASLAEASIAIDVPRSLLNGELILGSLTVSGVSLSVIYHRDGSIAIAGLGAVAERNKVSADNGGAGAMLGWLFSQEHLALENSTIHWYDERFSRQDLQFINVNLELQNDDERHQFDGSASLPDDLGRRFSFAIDLLGDVFIAGGWSGHAYINGAGLQTASLLNWLPLPGIRVDKGVAELRLWTEWQASRLQQLDGEVSIFGMQLSSVPAEAYPALRTELLDSLSGRFHWQRHVDGWQFDVNRFIVGRRGQFWPQSNYHLIWSSPSPGAEMQNGTSVDESLTAEMAEIVSPASARTDAEDNAAEDEYLQLSADYLRLDDVLALFQLSDVDMPAVRDTLTHLQPSGELRNLRLQWHADSDRIAVDSEITAVSLQPWKKFPGISGLSGRVIADKRGGRLELDSHQLNFDSRPLFRQKLAIETLKGLVYWRRDDSGWHWSGRDLSVATADVSVDSDIDIDLPADGGTPYLDLVAGFASRPHGVTNVSTYLPVGIMHEKTVKWLEQALINGTINNGGLVMQGPLNRFPYEQSDGRFEVRFVVEDGILDYAADWPRLDELETEVVFSGRQMNINAVSGKLLDADLDVVHASIDDLKAKPAQLRIVGDVNGTTTDVLKFLQVSPLHKRYGQYVENVQASGRSRVDIDLLLPLAAGHKDTIDGAVTLQDSGLVLAGGKVDLSGLNGRIGFSEQGLQADDISGRVMGLDARFSVATADDTRVTTVTATGNADIDELRAIIDPPLFDQFGGRSNWRAQLSIPGKDDAGSTLQISSDLRGLATHLPPPLAKPADQAVHLVAEMNLPVAPDRPVTVQLDDDISIILALDKQLHMQRGEIRFADGPAKLPATPGMRIAGVFPAFSFSQWTPLLKHAATAAASATPTGDGVNQLDVNVADVELFRRHFTNASVRALWQGGSWQAQIDSTQLKGTAQVPVDAETPLIMDMERMYLSSSTAAGAEEDDPRDWPPLHIQSRSFHFDDIDFGSLLVNASRGPAGLHMNELQLHSADMDIQAHGDWLFANDKQFSSFAINFDSSDVGKSLSRLGYADTIKGGKGNFFINARWPGEPLAFALARLDGNMHLRIDNGRLLDVDPGVGRIFGLLSLQALPRRLILDFRDVFSKGFAFDRISGDFDVKNGQATTSNLIMKGPSAKIAAQGRVGLAEHDYDQIVTVVPDVAGTVPMITALTQGAGVGAVVLLLKKLLEPELDKVSMILYKVTGSWDDPKVVRVENPAQLDAGQQSGRAVDGTTKKTEKQ